MGAGSHLVLYGNSMFLAGIRAELERLTSLRIITMATGGPDAAARIASLDPHVVLFDLSADQPGFAVSLLRRQPGLLLIGVDPSTDKLMVLSCQPAEALSVPDLVEVINQKVLSSQTGKGIER